MNIFIEKLHKAIDFIPPKALKRAIHAIQNSTHIYVFGNGGSWALAQHFTADLSKQGFNIICIPSSGAELTMWANDDGYENVFMKSLQSRIIIWKDDIIIAISSSGNSPNIIKAVEYAQSTGATVIGLSGFDEENKLNQLADIKLHIPTEKGEYGIVETTHDAILHLLVEELKHELHIR